MRFFCFVLLGCYATWLVYLCYFGDFDGYVVVGLAGCLVCVNGCWLAVVGGFGVCLVTLFSTFVVCYCCCSFDSCCCGFVTGYCCFVVLSCIRDVFGFVWLLVGVLFCVFAGVCDRSFGSLVVLWVLLAACG